MEVTYRARPGSPLTDASAAKLGTFIERTFGEDGCTAEQLVFKARPKRSPIHRYFEWDDTIAANAYREKQARDYLGAIEIVYVRNETPEHTRAYHNVVVGRNGESERAYVPARVVWKQEELAYQVVSKARRELESWTDRYREYSAQHDEIGALLESVEEALAA